MEYVIHGTVVGSLSRYHNNCIIREVIWRRIAAEPISAMLLACPQSAKRISSEVLAKRAFVVPSRPNSAGQTWLSLGERTVGSGRRQWVQTFRLHCYTVAEYEKYLVARQREARLVSYDPRSQFKSDCE